MKKTLCGLALAACISGNSFADETIITKKEVKNHKGEVIKLIKEKEVFDKIWKPTPLGFARINRTRKWSRTVSNPQTKEKLFLEHRYEYSGPNKLKSAFIQRNETKADGSGQSEYLADYDGDGYFNLKTDFIFDEKGRPLQSTMSYRTKRGTLSYWHNNIWNYNQKERLISFVKQKIKEDKNKRPFIHAETEWSYSYKDKGLLDHYRVVTSKRRKTHIPFFGKQELILPEKIMRVDIKYKYFGVVKKIIARVDEDCDGRFDAKTEFVRIPLQRYKEFNFADIYYQIGKTKYSGR